MAEAFARRYGTDVMEPASAGLYPAPVIQPLTFKVMQQKNVKLDGQFPKGLDAVDVPKFNLIVNMTGRSLPGKTMMEVMEWRVQDPIGQSEAVYVTVRDELEMLVMRLILELRRREKVMSAPRKVEILQPARRTTKK
jgi:protein-tyrosine-phosphatase